MSLSSSLRALFAAALCLVPFGRADAQDVAPPLRLRLAEGQTVRLREVRHTHQFVDASLISLETVATVATDYTIVGAGPAEGGRLRATVRVDRVRGALETPITDRTLFDSAGEPDPDQTMFELPITAFAGAEFTVEFAPDGSIAEIGGVEEARAAAAARRPAGDDLAPLLLGKFFSEARLHERLGWLLRLGAYPSSVPTPETSWNDSDALPGPTNVSFDVQSARRVASVSANVVAITSVGKMRATPAAGRDGETTKLIAGGTFAENTVTSTASVSRSDGFPISIDTRISTLIDVTKSDGDSGSFAQTVHSVVERLTTAEQSAADPIALVTGDNAAPPSLAALAILELGAREALDLKEFQSATELRAQALRDARSIEAAAPDSVIGTGAVFGAATTLANHYFYFEWFDVAAAAADEAVAAAERLMRAERETGPALDRLASAYVQRGRIVGAAGAIDDARGTFEKAVGLCETHLAEHAGDRNVRITLAWALEAQSEFLAGAGDSKGALVVAHRALALLDVLAPPATASPGARERVGDLCQLHGQTAAQAGDFAAAAALYERAATEAGKIAADNPNYGDWAVYLRTRAKAAQTVLANGTAESPDEALHAGYVLYDGRQYARSVRHFEAALADTSIRENWDASNLYNAACAAALAHAAATGDDKARFEKLALSWVGEQVTFLAGVIAEEGDAPSSAKDYLEWCRNGDADLASLRALPAWEKLFTN